MTAFPQLDPTPAAWTAAQLEADRTRWTFRLDERARCDLVAALTRAMDPAKTLFDYRREDFDLGSAQPVLQAAFAEVQRGRGVALVKGLPREGLDEKDFELLTWGIGLHFGVGRPQGLQSHYVSAVRDVGNTYRSGRGRGYNTNAELDFHTDSADIVALSCYNRAVAGGMSITTSSVAAFEAMRREHPDLAALLLEPIHFSRQGEQAADEAPSYPHPIFDSIDGKLFSKWNRNRVTSAQQIPGVPQLDARHWQALEAFDALVRRPDLAHNMWLEPGDLQIINSHVTLHSRTDFTDHEDPAQKRLLFRLWLAPPDGDRLPQSWKVLYRAVGRGSVRGGIIGQHHDEARRAYEARQAAALCMKLSD
ncbi:MAG: TauD/TfdA family dioxygenase [Betaproteobacteria bacterium]|nr:TauD/TfdA family dioxygenase [Betaproteobacteria bacterium]